MDKASSQEALYSNNIFVRKELRSPKIQVYIATYNPVSSYLHPTSHSTFKLCNLEIEITQTLKLGY